MAKFHLFVSVGALVLLIIVLIVIGVMLTKMNSYSVFPPTQNACPDYWDVSSNPNYCGVPIASVGAKNVGYLSINPSVGLIDACSNNLGMCQGSTFGCTARGVNSLLDHPAVVANDPFQYVHLGSDNANWNSAAGLYPGKTTLCAQNAWANAMGITWDGVSNYNGC